MHAHRYGFVFLRQSNRTILLWHQRKQIVSSYVKGSFYIVQYPVRWTAQSALHFSSPGRPVHSDTNSASPRSILVMLQLRAKTKSLPFPTLSIARYSFIQLSQQGCQWRERKCPIFETVAKGDSNPGSLDCESGILPLSYRAPRWCRTQFWYSKPSLYQLFLHLIRIAPSFMLDHTHNLLGPLYIGVGRL